MIDNELYPIQLEELEVLNHFFIKPINCNINNKTDPEQVVEALFDELLNSRKKASKIIEIAKSFQSYFEKSAQKVKELKRDKLVAIDKYESTLTQLEIFEKTVFDNEEKIEYLTNEIYDLEAAIRESNKAKEAIKKELSELKKERKQKVPVKDDGELKALSFAKKEIEKKLSEAQIDINKKAKTIEEMSKILSGYENKFLNDRASKDGQTSQINALKNQIFEKNNKISELKTKIHSLRANIQSVEEELIKEQDQNAALTNDFTKLKEKEKELIAKIEAKSKPDPLILVEQEYEYEIEAEAEESSASVMLDENLEEIPESRAHTQRSELLSDFFTEEDRIDTEESQANGNLVYFITSPNFRFPRSTSMSISAGELISIQSKAKHVQNSFSFGDNHRIQSKTFHRPPIEHSDGPVHSLDARKKHFIKVFFI